MDFGIPPGVSLEQVFRQHDQIVSHGRQQHMDQSDDPGGMPGPLSFGPEAQDDMPPWWDAANGEPQLDQEGSHVVFPPDGRAPSDLPPVAFAPLDTAFAGAGRAAVGNPELTEPLLGGARSAATALERVLPGSGRVTTALERVLPGVEGVASKVNPALIAGDIAYRAYDAYNSVQNEPDKPLRGSFDIGTTNGERVRVPVYEGDALPFDRVDENGPVITEESLAKAIPCTLR